MSWNKFVVHFESRRTCFDPNPTFLKKKSFVPGALTKTSGAGALPQPSLQPQPETIKSSLSAGRPLDHCAQLVNQVGFPRRWRFWSFNFWKPDPKWYFFTWYLGLFGLNSGLVPHFRPFFSWGSPGFWIWLWMVNLKSGQLWGWLDDVDKRQFLGGSGWCRKSWIDGVGSLGNIRWYSLIFHYQMIPDASSFWWGHRDSWLPTLDPCSRAEGPVGCSTEGRRSLGLGLSKTAGQDVLSLAESQLMWIPRRSWPFMTYYITYIYIYINHIMTAASIQFYSRFVETSRHGDIFWGARPPGDGAILGSFQHLRNFEEDQRKPGSEIGHPH